MVDFGTPEIGIPRVSAASNFEVQDRAEFFVTRGGLTQSKPLPLFRIDKFMIAALKRRKIGTLFSKYELIFYHDTKFLKKGER